MASTYLTYGGFDWMTATVGGMWDALLSEGTLFTITANSDNHRTVHDTLRNGDWAPGQTFDTTGRLPDPVDAGAPQPGSDFWLGQISRTHVGVTRYGCREVMAGLRAGRVWVDHGQLVDGIQVWLSTPTRRVTLGGRLRVKQRDKVTLTVTVTSASRPNYRGELPRLAHLDVIRGVVGRRPQDRDSWRAPPTRVVRTVDVSGRTGTYTVEIPLGKVRGPGYLRLRGSDGRRHGPGLSAPLSTRTGRSLTRPVTVTRGLTPGSTPTRSSSIWSREVRGLPAADLTVPSAPGYGRVASTRIGSGASAALCVAGAGRS